MHIKQFRRFMVKLYIFSNQHLLSTVREEAKAPHAIPTGAKLDFAPPMCVLSYGGGVVRFWWKHPKNAPNDLKTCI